jgi:hypothetical protein
LGYAEYQVLAILTLDCPHFDRFDECGPVMGINDSLADLKSHMDEPLSESPTLPR